MTVSISKDVALRVTILIALLNGDFRLSQGQSGAIYRHPGSLVEADDLICDCLFTEDTTQELVVRGLDILC